MNTDERPETGVHRRIRSVAWLMDNSVPLPGGYRIGLDGLLGLVPGVGDFIGSAVSSWIIYEAHRAGAPKRTLFKMLGNTGMDLLFGLVPVVGDIFDFTYKANSRNVKLLQKHLDAGETKRNNTDRGFITFILLVALGLFACAAVVISLVATALWNLASVN